MVKKRKINVRKTKGKKGEVKVCKAESKGKDKVKSKSNKLHIKLGAIKVQDKHISKLLYGMPGEWWISD